MNLCDRIINQGVIDNQNAQTNCLVSLRSLYIMGSFKMICRNLGQTLLIFPFLMPLVRTRPHD